MKINIHTSHPSAFISSTFIDLREERKAVANVLSKANLNINAIDVKPAANDSSKKEIINGIKESDFLILIVGERYGSIIPEMTRSRKHSITRWEYIKAVKRYRKDALVYFKNVESGDSVHYDDRTSGDYDRKRKLLAEFKNELSSIHSPKYFSTPEELAEEVKKALIPTYRAGVKALTKRNESLLKEIETLKQENQHLKTIGQGHKENNSSDLIRGGLGLRGLKGVESSTNKSSYGLGLLGPRDDINRNIKK